MCFEGDGRGQRALAAILRAARARCLHGPRNSRHMFGRAISDVRMSAAWFGRNARRMRAGARPSCEQHACDGWLRNNETFVAFFFHATPCTPNRLALKAGVYDYSESSPAHIIESFINRGSGSQRALITASYSGRRQ